MMKTIVYFTLAYTSVWGKGACQKSGFILSFLFVEFNMERFCQGWSLEVYLPHNSAIKVQ